MWYQHIKLTYIRESVGPTLLQEYGILLEVLDLPLHEATKNLLSHLKGHVCFTGICKHPLSSPWLQLFPNVWPSQCCIISTWLLLPWGLPYPSFLAPGKRTRKMLCQKSQLFLSPHLLWWKAQSGNKCWWKSLLYLLLWHKPQSQQHFVFC